MGSSPRVKDYIKSSPNDLTASLVVVLVALPLCLGVALASKAAPFSGLIAGIIGGIVVGLASKSHLSVSGPAAGLTAIVAAAITTLPSFEAFLLAVVVCGVLQVAFGFLKAGVFGDYVPSSVIKGMLAAIGLILILKQIPHLVGYDKDWEGDVAFQQADKANTFTEIINAFQHPTTLAIIIGVACLLFHFLWEKFAVKKGGFVKLIPAPLLVVLVGIGIHQLFIMNGSSYTIQDDQLVKIPMASSAREFFSFFTSPDWSQVMNTKVLVTGLTLAIVASLESLLSIEAVDDLDQYQRVTPTNRELKAQGLGNIVSGLVGGLPITSVIVRSSANVNAGAKTKMSTIYHGTFLLLSVAFIPSILNLIPNAALAAILIYTGFKLAKPALFVSFFKKGWNHFLPFVITILAILFTDLLKGVVIGIGVGLFFVLRNNFKTSVFVVNDKNQYLFRLRKDVTFLNKPIIKSKLEKVPEDSTVLIDASRADFIDKDVIEVIEDFMKHAPLKNITVELKTTNGNTQGFSLQPDFGKELNGVIHNGRKAEESVK